MAASDHLQHYQYKMFVQSKDLMNIPSGEYFGAGKTLAENSEMRQQKLRRSKTSSIYDKHATDSDKSSLYDSIRDKGVTTPVVIGLNRENSGKLSEYLADGHHRATAANDINPEMYVPIEYW